jgi:hypothetical protein
LPPQVADSRSFGSLLEGHTKQVVTRLKRALADIVHSIPDLRIERPNDLAHALALDPKLAWKISKVLDCDDPFAAAQYIPGSGALRIFLRAAAARNAAADSLDSARRTFAEFDDLVRIHAGSRKLFDMMLAGCAVQDQLRAAAEQRKLAFLGNSYTFGVQARVVMRTLIAGPSADPLMWDGVAIRAFVDLRRIRPNVAWLISRPSTVDESHARHTQFESEPLDPDAGPMSTALPLVRRFCSVPLPEYRLVAERGGYLEYELAETSVGNTGLLTCVTGEIVRRVEPRYRTAQYRDFAVAFLVRTPAELLVFDLLVHRALFPGRTPHVQLFSDLFEGSRTFRYRESDALPVLETLECLSAAPDALRLKELPRYPELVQYAFERVGWRPEEFQVFRLRMQYPALATTLLLKHELPDHP